jgi:hypothetical protein
MFTVNSGHEDSPAPLSRSTPKKNFMLPSAQLDDGVSASKTIITFLDLLVKEIQQQQFFVGFLDSFLSTSGPSTRSQQLLR